MPYKIPDEPDVSEFEYYLVAIPADPLYRQAIKGHYSDLGSIRFWGLEGREAGSEAAAQSWQRAIAETWRLLEMGWPDLVLDFIDDIETILSAMQLAQTSQLTCCDGNGTFEPPPGGAGSTDPVPQPIIDAGYATGTSDYEGYASYKCMAAHLLLNNLEQKLVDLENIVEAGAAVLSVLLVLFGVVSGIAGIAVAGVVIGLGDLLGLIDALKDVGGSALPGLAGDLEDNREEIVCAIVGGDGIDDTITQFNAKIDELFTDTEALVIKSLNVRHMIQLLMYGEHGNANVAQALSDAGYDPADYECCVEEPPSGYAIVPVNFTACSGGVCTGTSFDGNTVTFANYSTTVGTSWTCDTQSVVGTILLVSLTGVNGAMTSGAAACTNNDISHSSALIQNGYHFEFTNGTHETAWSDYMANHTPNQNASSVACATAGRLNVKTNTSGSVSGTIQAWHIITV